MPTSNTRPCRRTLPRKLRLNCLPWASGRCHLAIDRHDPQGVHHGGDVDALGHRVVHASHEAHSQIACDPSTSSSAPRWTSRITWLGRKSISGPIGQPVLHLWHWKHALTGVPLRCCDLGGQIAAVPLNRVWHNALFLPFLPTRLRASASLRGITLR